MPENFLDPRLIGKPWWVPCPIHGKGNLLPVFPGENNPKELGKKPLKFRRNNPP